MGVTGHSLQPLIQRLSALSHSRRQTLTVLAETARKLVVDQFAQSKDPYGNSWRPSKRRGQVMGTGSILRDTARLQNSIIPRPTSVGLRVNSNVKYAAVHNYGGRRMPRRQFLPQGDLGPVWSEAFRKQLSALVREVMHQ